MKRSILICAVSALMFLTACTHTVPELPGSFESGFSATGGALDCEGRVICDGGAVTVEMTSPEAVKGIGFSFTDGELTASYSGLSCITDSGRIASFTVPYVLSEVFTNLGKAYYVKSDGEDDLFALELSEGRAELVFSGGRIKTVTADFTPYSFTFTDPDMSTTE